MKGETFTGGLNSSLGKSHFVAIPLINQFIQTIGLRIKILNQNIIDCRTQGLNKRGFHIIINCFQQNAIRLSIRSKKLLNFIQYIDCHTNQ